MNSSTLSGRFLAAFGPLCLICTHALAAEPQQVHRYLESVPSPDGHWVASVEGDAPLSGRSPVVRELVVRNLQTQAQTTVPLECGRVRECWPASLAWSPDGTRLAFALRAPGSHARSVYGVQTGDWQSTRLLQFDGTVTALRYAADGRLAVLAVQGANKEVGATQAGAPVAGEADATTPEQRIGIIADGALHWASPPNLFVYEYDWLPGGRGFVGTAAPGDGDSQWWVAKLYRFDAGSGTGRVLYTPAASTQQLADPIVSADGRSVMLIAGVMSDFGSTGGDVLQISLNDGSAVNLTPHQHASAEALGLDCAGHLQVMQLTDDQTQIVELDPTTRATRLLWSGERTLDGHDAGVSYGCPSAITTTVAEDFTTPPEIQAGPIGAWRALTHANEGLSQPSNVRSLHWKSDGHAVQGWLLWPKDDNHAPRALITEVHGGPAAAATPEFGGFGMLHALLDRGFALLLPNPRGSFGQGEEFTLGNVRDLGHGDLRDILRGIDAAKAALPIDESRLGIMGGSYGGYFAMWSVTQTQRFHAAVAAAGISDWLSYYGENGIDQWLLPYFGASVYDDPKIYARSSPINFIRQVHTPTLEYVGENDIECPAPQTQEFWHALVELGVPTSMIIYPQEGHGLRDPQHVEDSERRVLAWFERYLPAHP